LSYCRVEACTVQPTECAGLSGTACRWLRAGKGTAAVTCA